MEIFRANNQWATRPADERFLSIQAMHDACVGYYTQAATATVPWADLRFQETPVYDAGGAAKDPDLVMVGPNGSQARLAHYAFGQLVSRMGEGKPVADYLRTLPPRITAECLNRGIGAKGDRTAAQLLLHQNGGLLLRAATSDVYERIWNWEVTERLLDLQSKGFEAAVPDFTFAELAHSAEPDLYASDHDMFAFVRHPDRVVDDGTEYGLRRGMIVFNSEVGDCSLGVMYFLYRYQCGNHIIWGADNVREVRVPHRGEKARARFGDFIAELARTAFGASTEAEEQAIATARNKLIGATKADVLDALFGKRAVLGLSRKLLTAGYDATVPDEDGDPRTVWGFVNGLTRHSQTVKFADDRTTLDRAAGKVMSIAF